MGNKPVRAKSSKGSASSQGGTSKARGWGEREGGIEDLDFILDEKLEKKVVAIIVAVVGGGRGL